MSEQSAIVLLTGANSGVGYATTKVLVNASAGYHVIMAGRSSQKIEQAASEIKAAGIKGSLSTLVLDVTDEESIAKAVTGVQSQFGRVDVLINNAGMASRSPNMKKQLEETILTNTIAPVIVTEAFTPLVLASKQPRILHVTSGLGSLEGASNPSHALYPADYFVYRMSKSALNMFMIQNHKDLSKQGVKVFAVCPGLVKSNLRGTEEHEIDAGGRAVDPEVSGILIQDIIEGRRDADIGKCVQKDGVWPW